MEPIVFDLPSNGAWIVLIFIIVAVCMPISLHIGLMWFICQRRRILW